MCAHIIKPLFRKLFPKTRDNDRNSVVGTQNRFSSNPNSATFASGFKHATPTTSIKPDVQQRVGSRHTELSDPTTASTAQTESRHNVHVAADTPVVGRTAGSEEQALSTALPLTSIETITDKHGRQIQVKRVLDATTSPDGVVIPGIARSQTFLSDTLEDEPRISDLPKLLTAVEEQEHHEIAIVSPQYATLPRRRSARSQVYLTDVPNNIFPTKIRCCLDVTFEEGQKFEDAYTIGDFAWYERDNYKKIKDAIDKIKEVFLDYNIVKESDSIYLRYASCFVKGSRNQSSHETDDTILIDEEDMDEVLPDAAIRAICGFIHFHPFQTFELRIHCDYSAIDRSFVLEGDLSSWPTDKMPFHGAIHDEYEKKMRVGRPTIKKQRYLSPADHKVLITPEIGKRIIEEDALSSQKLTVEEKVKLIKELKARPASFLQAVCVYRNIPMRFLYHLLFDAPHIEQKCSDDRDTLRLNTPVTCDDELCTKYYERLAEHIHLFFPEIIRHDPQLSLKHERAVVPVRYGEQRVHLGGGGFGNVYEVDIDPHCQLISPDIKRTYALKEFTTNSKMVDAFDHEIKMLIDLSRYLPHEHILTHIASWEQEGTYHILYERAHGNLRQHMENCDGGVLTYQRTLWFFYQLRGLSDAIRRIHFFREPGVDAVTGDPLPRKTGVIGCHHDIKPENILTFDLPEDLPTLKLSDFGAGKFSHVKDQKDSIPPASGARFTRTYAGPESDQAMRNAGEKITRPFDMWAVGCVFIELLLWFLGIKYPDNELTFLEMRVAKKYNRQDEDDYFWQRDDVSGDFRLNKAVTYVLKTLQDKHCKDMPPFQDLIQLIRQLLRIMPKERLKAIQLFNALDAIFVKAKAELDRSPQCYADMHERNKFPSASSREPHTPNPNFLDVKRLEDDISINSESRTESATRLKDQDAVVVAARPEDERAAEAELHASGSQFSGADSSPDVQLPPFSDDSDTAYMKTSANTTSILKHIEETSRTFQDDV